ncbi:MAG: response regulator [Bacteroidota bacterium]|nr:response regulator [Bacteroidota bacterium]MDP3145496.1 response regulator [Bacteroidota bacterium]MDP3556456.1 response regulator [Bacteroidota bacterium]
MKIIYIIDDDETNNYIAELLIKSVLPDVKLTGFTNPIKALSGFTDSNIEPNDVILLDLNMPQMDGWQFLEKFNEKNIACRVFILTSSLNPLDRELAANNPSVTGFISKPLTKEKINSMLA